MQELLRLRDEGKLNEIQSQWFRTEKDPEELFDLENDPHELNNLINDLDHYSKLKELRLEMDQWLDKIGDTPNLPERNLIESLWEGNTEQPITQDPIITVEDNENFISLNSLTDGSSIGFKLIKKDAPEPKSWNIYLEPFELKSGDSLQVIAHRIGFKPSKIIIYTKTN